MSNPFPHPFGKLAQKYREMRRRLPMEVSIIANNDFKLNFKMGGYYTEGGFVAWEPRAATDTNASKRALLIKSGRLRRGFVNAPYADTARVRNYTPYAKIHNEGGKLNGTVTVRSHRRKNGSKVKSHSRKMNSTIPARPYMITGSRLIDKIDKHINTKITDIFNTSDNA